MKILHFLIVFVAVLLAPSLYAQESEKPIHIGEKHVLKSEILQQDRTIFISLPENYDSSEAEYAVHYVLDGRITFRLYSGLVALKAGGEDIPESIVVGIPNINRGFDLDFRQNGDNFLRFISDELIPYVDAKYRTNKTRLLAGYSMSGNFVLNAFLSNTSAFTLFLSGSPYRTDLFTEERIDKRCEAGSGEVKLYTSMGDEDRKKQLDFFKTFCELLEEKENESIDFKYEILPKRNHDDSYLLNWQDGLNYLFKEWKGTK